ncbi:MAG: NADH-quinone oxidoreductase subunit NuoG [Bacteroidota bacterium]
MEMIRLTIDGKEYEVQPGRNLLDTCLSLGFNIPHFCYHHALGSVGSCRLCAVKMYIDAGDPKGMIVMSCMIPVKSGLIIVTDDSAVLEFRKSVLENLMTNHPHDCPVCDEGGECHLQDMTVMTGHNARRFDFKKRTHLNQDLGPNIYHEMNRCIQCYRCVRFYKDYAGGKDFGVFGAHNNVYFGRYREGTLESEFSGNLVEVCPTGVFTDKTFKKHPTRKWDLNTAPSVCTHCGAGCNIIGGERYGTLRRIMNRYNENVNGYFLCDRGRFGYDFVNAPERIRDVVIKHENISENTNLVSLLPSIIGKDKKIIGIGSPCASLEANFALMSFTGKENFYNGVSKKDFSFITTVLDILKNSPSAPPSRGEMERSDAVLILGEDILKTSPITSLAIRQAARNLSKKMAAAVGIPAWHDSAVRTKGIHLKSPVYITGTQSSKLDDIAAEVLNAPAEISAQLGFAIASYISKKAPETVLPDAALSVLAKKIADDLMNAEYPLVISGIDAGNSALPKAASNIVHALAVEGKNAKLLLILPECNSMGIGMMGGKDLDDAITEFDSADTLVVLENDLYKRLSKEQADELFGKFKNIIALHHSHNSTTSAADIVLPSGTFAESEGTFVNNQGYAQRAYSVFQAKEPIMDSWRWISDLIELSGYEKSRWQNFDDLVNDMVRVFPEFLKIAEILPNADLRISGQKIPRQTPRFSGRTAMNAKTNVSEQKPEQDTDSALAFSMEGYSGIPPAALIPNYRASGWNSTQAIYKYIDGADGSNITGDTEAKLIEPLSGKPAKFFDAVTE